MSKKEVQMKVRARKVKIFKISNRKGYAAICSNHLTEGKTSLQAYQRLIKALKRTGKDLPVINAQTAKKLVITKM